MTPETETPAETPAPETPEARPRRRRGRPHKLTPEVEAAIVAGLRLGASRPSAAVAAGVDYASFRRWMRKAEAGEQLFVRFRLACAKADAWAEVAAVAKIRRSARWQSAAWWLERVHPERWAKVAHQRDSLLHRLVAGRALDGEVTPSPLPLHRLTEAELATLDALLARLADGDPAV